MPISKDTIQDVYTIGIEHGRDLIRHTFKDSDMLDIVLDEFDDRSADRVMHQQPEEIIKLVRNFKDGMEDGIKSQLGRECSEVVSALRAT